MTVTRREVLRRIAAGGTLASVSQLLVSCAAPESRTRSNAITESSRLESFGLSDAELSAAMSELTRNGADIADIFLQQKHSTTLRLDEQFVKLADTQTIRGAGLRVIRGDSEGFRHVDDLSPESLAAAARDAARSDSIDEIAPAHSLSHSGPGHLYPIDVPFAVISVDDRMNLLRHVDDYARQLDPAVVNVIAHWTDADEQIAVATQDGRLVFDERPLARLGVQIVAAREGRVQSGYAHLSAREGFGWFDHNRIEETVRMSFERTMSMFDAVRIREGDMPVVLTSATASVLIHETIGHALEADYVLSGKTPLRDSTGQRIAGDEVTIVDDALMPGARGALNVDDEGIAGQRSVLVEDGYLKSFLFDRRSALAHKVASTGSGRREDYRFAPMPRMRCTSMQSGSHDPAEIIEAAENGIVAETFADGSVDLASGDFSFVLKNGWLVEKGKITVPVKDLVVAGNAIEMLAGISMVGNDSAMDPGGWTCVKNGQRIPVSVGMPTVLVPSLAVRNKPDNG